MKHQFVLIKYHPIQSMFIEVDLLKSFRSGEEIYDRKSLLENVERFRRSSEIYKNDEKIAKFVYVKIFLTFFNI